MCLACRTQVLASICSQDFILHCVQVLLPVAILMALGTGFYFASGVIQWLKEEINRWH